MSEGAESTERAEVDGILDQYLNVHFGRSTADGVKGEIVWINGRRVLIMEEVARWCLKRG